ncbi:MAG: PLP-dependent transferase [Ruminococcus sp.]|nr:PLP-dependent transferase [Ruminococcus sp.]
MSIEKFVRGYADMEISRFHMPAHKGTPLLGGEPYDITEIKGADSLFESDGIISESERHTADAFGSLRTCYSAEGSSLSIKGALCAVRRLKGRPIRVAASRSCHGAFISACALLGIEPEWLLPDSPRNMLCECRVSANAVADALDSSPLPVDAVYITSPDYLGQLADVKGIAKVCHERGTILIVDNAHGAYLKFLTPSLHPLDMGADLVCDSAHKTLPVYTGGGYLHISKQAPEGLAELCKPSMLMFGSTSPSYLIMQSLDRCAGLLHGGLPEMIRRCCRRTSEVKAVIESRGIRDISEEPMKITVAADFGYDGRQLAELMRQSKMEPEYADPYAVVLMLSPYNTDRDFERLTEFFSNIEVTRSADADSADNSLLFAHRPEKAVSLREAMLSSAQAVPPDDAVGRICARAAMSCQPSVAVVMPGEIISAESVKILKRYSIPEIYVV